MHAGTNYEQVHRSSDTVATLIATVTASYTATPHHLHHHCIFSYPHMAIS